MYKTTVYPNGPMPNGEPREPREYFGRLMAREIEKAKFYAEEYGMRTKVERVEQIKSASGRLVWNSTVGRVTTDTLRNYATA